MNSKENGRQSPKPEHLLGGYATGSLSADEQKLLLESALTDQKLFDELMKEQALKETLDQPGVRRELIAALDSRPSAWARLQRWVSSPVAWTAAGAVAASVLVVLFVERQPAKTTPAAAPLAAQKQLAVALPPASPVVTRETVAPQPQLKDSRKALPASASKPAPSQSMVLSRRMEGPAEALADVQPPPAPEVPAGVAMGRAAATAPPPPAAVIAEVAELRKAPPAAPRLDHGILRADNSGVFRPVAAVRELSDSDRFKITVTPNVDGALLVYRRNRDQSTTVLTRTLARGGSTIIIPAEDSIRTGDVDSLVLEFGGSVAEEDARPVFGFRQPSQMKVREQAASQDKENLRAKAESAPAGIRIEIPIRLR